MNEERLKRINELARKKKAEGLTPEETREQERLRRDYIKDFRANLRGELDKIDILEADGSITNLGEEHGEKANKSGKTGHSGADVRRAQTGGPAGAPKGQRTDR